MTYTALQALLADYLHRADLTSRIPGFIRLAEAFLFRELNIKALEVAVLGVTDGGLIALPLDCASVARLSVFYSGTDNALDYSSLPRQWSAGGVPLSYTLEAGGLRLDSSAAGYGYTLFYTPVITALSDTNPTNWLLSNAPDLYLAASQLEGARYTQNTDQIALLGGMLPALLDSVQRLTKRTGQPMRGGMQIKPRGIR